MIVVPRMGAMQYDGTNAEALAEWIGNATVVTVAEDGELTLSVTAWGVTYDVQVLPSWWTLTHHSMHQGSMSPEDFAWLYIELPGT